MTLEAYLQNKKLTKRQFAEELGCTRQTVHNWLSGASTPSPRFWPALDEREIDYPKRVTRLVWAAA